MTKFPGDSKFLRTIKTAALKSYRDYHSIKRLSDKTVDDTQE